ncbi:MAG: nucleotide-binding protein [Planctomycetia bacterium]|nr:nucleotide-binding protein [Planctomycetia bacterium]
MAWGDDRRTQAGARNRLRLLIPCQLNFEHENHRMATTQNGPSRPLVFIGSSSEGIDVAMEIQAALVDKCDVIVWNQFFFHQGQAFLEGLTSQVDKFDFAVLVFTPDDSVNARGKVGPAPRDNVLFELGLFMGGLSRSRTFVIYEDCEGFKIPSDLAGIAYASYRRSEVVPLTASLGPPCLGIRKEIVTLGLRKRSFQQETLPPPTSPKQGDIEDKVGKLVDEHSDIIGASEAPPGMELWYEQLRPVLRQSVYYTTPTYWLDTNLNVLDWNIAFDLVFSEIAPILQYRHVNELIARLANYDAVFNHAREFSRRVNDGEMPACDIEPLVYQSARYGDVRMLKVATQLHDIEGSLRGWNVSLLLQQLDWELFQRLLEERINDDKMWSVYASAYDRILTGYPPYQKLLSDVASVVPASAAMVLDVGAGTGNSTGVLLERGFSVVSLEKNATMIDHLRARHFDAAKHRIVKGSADTLHTLRSIQDGIFDAVILVNVLYGLDDPLACLKGVNRVLKPGGVVGLSTTHSAISLDLLLANIKTWLMSQNLFDSLQDDYDKLCEVNIRIEHTIARRHSADNYREMLREAGFTIERCEDYTYQGAVMLVHARKLG